MAVFRVNKNTNYTCMSNVHLRDRRMTLKAKGLLSVMLNLPDDWDYSISGLAAISKESGAAIRSALGELEGYGYLKRTKAHDPGTGKFDYIYDIYETAADPPHTEEPHTEEPYTVDPHTEEPHTEEPYTDEPHTHEPHTEEPYTDEPHTHEPHTEEPHTEEPHTEEPHTENRAQINTHQRNTKRANTNRANMKRAGTKHVRPPTLEEVKAYCRERNSTVDPERFYEYFEAGNWVDSKGQRVKHWKQKILTWEKYTVGAESNGGNRPKTHRGTTVGTPEPVGPGDLVL